MNLLQDMRRRRVFRVLGVYIVGAWLIIQVASTFFPAWNIPDTALRYLIYAAVLGFPVAGIFGWAYDITPQGIVRTASSDSAGDLSLQSADYFVLGALQSLMNFVKADIDRQRLQVEKIDAEHDFRAEVDAILAVLSQDSSP